MYALLICSSLFLIYFIIRLYLLRRSIREVNGELNEIRADINQNHILHLPFPEKTLEVLMSTINSTLLEVRNERKTYLKRERDFQMQIEAISHDLRTPLTVILGYLKLLKRNGTFDFDDQDMLETIIKKAEAMENLISQFYDHSRLIAGDYDMSFEEIDVNRILREVLAENFLILENAKLKVHTHFPNRSVIAKGNKNALERIFLNLLQNIGRYAYSYVDMKIEKNNNRVVVIFENDTNKLQDKDIESLFERFFMKDTSRTQGGSGLGLTIAKSLAEEMEGSLEAKIMESLGDLTAIQFMLSLSSLEI